MAYKILFSNIGYAKGIDGSLRQHVNLFGRHFYCAVPVQEQVLRQVKTIIDAERPDLCCFVEIDYGSIHAAGLNQIDILKDADYCFHDITGKYGQGSLLSRMPLHMGKGNGFLARREIPFERLYFTQGAKRLVYRMQLDAGLSVFFSHFSLSKKVRARQLEEMGEFIRREKGEVALLADFNILDGFSELAPILKACRLNVLNKEEEHTFTFHSRKLALDLCLCTDGLRDRAKLKIVPQPFSDHAALLLELT